MKRIAAILMLIVLIASVLSACADKTPAADAYMIVFNDLYEQDPALNDGIDYLALDLSAVLTEDKPSITALFEAFCSDNSLTLLLESYGSLVEKGYVKDLYFENGLLVAFSDQSVTTTKLVTKASKWRSGTGAIGATYTVTATDGAWEISDVTGTWIS